MSKNDIIVQFEPLQEEDLPVLWAWLKEAHVKAWWDQETEKYKTYIKGYKLVQGIKKPIRAYLAKIEEVPVAYLQLYNAYDFKRDEPLPTDFPKSLCAVDFFIGNPAFVNKGLGRFILNEFLKKYNANKMLSNFY